MKLSTETTVVNDGKLNTNITNAQNSADNAQNTANDAKGIADNTAQNFWFKSDGTDTGAHITEVSQAEFEENPTGGNLLARTNGIALRDGLTEVATFEAGGITLGAEAGMTISADPSVGVRYKNEYDRTIFEINQTLLRLMDGDDETYAQLSKGGISYAPSSTIIHSGFNVNRNGSYANIILFGGDSTVVFVGARAQNGSVAIGSEEPTDNPSNVLYTLASGLFSLAQGRAVQATGDYSSAHGHGTKASGEAQVALGEWNVEDTTSKLLIGDGTSSARSNALMLDGSGNLKIKGEMYVGCSNDSSVGRKIDYTVEEGVSGNWTYRKWASGKREAWFCGNVAGSETTKVGQVYNLTYSLPIPQSIFLSAPNVNVSLAESTNTVMGINGGASSATAISGRIFRAIAGTAINYKISIYAWQN